MPALVTGDDQAVPEQVQTDFRTSGLTHLLAVSGTNLTLVVGFLVLVGRWCGVRGRWQYLLAVLGIVGFVLLARTEPSVVRAAAMGAVALLGLGGNGRDRGVRALGVAVTALLLWDPWLAVSPGFVLSVLATAGILLLGPPWTEALGRWLPRWAAQAVAVPVAAQLVCTPVVAGLSGQVSLVAVVANLLAAPLVAPATVLGLLGGLVGLVWPAGGSGAGLVCRALRGRDRRGGPAQRRAAAAGRRLGDRCGRAGGADRGLRRPRAGPGAAARATDHRHGLLPAARAGGAGAAAEPRLAAARLGVRGLRRGPGRRARAPGRTRAARSSWTPARIPRWSTAASTGSTWSRCRCWCSPTSTPTTSTGWRACTPAAGSGRST